MSRVFWNEIPELADAALLRRLVLRYGTTENIAVHLGCSRWSVKTALRHHGLHTIPRKLAADGGEWRGADR